jgi:polysaccharide deacetylase family protein (PEP-CTERM system associated)
MRQEVLPEVHLNQHAFTVDVEDWYHGANDVLVRTSGDRRLHYGLGTLLDLLAEHHVKGTFFWLGLAAQENPHLVKQVAAAGHEIGCHGWSHEPVYTMSPQRFHAETQQATRLIADLAGQPVTAYRAPYFSITRRSLWALEILAELGFRYDSSIFPIHNWRYGIPDFEPRPQQIHTSAGPIYELPLSVWQIWGQNLPIGGGAYFRLYPFALTRYGFHRAEQKGYPIIFYIHPWELDLDHPPVPLCWQERLTHAVNLHTAEQKLRRLLQEFSFAPLRQILEHPVKSHVTL